VAAWPLLNEAKPWFGSSVPRQEDAGAEKRIEARESRFDGGCHSGQVDTTARECCRNL